MTERPPPAADEPSPADPFSADASRALDRTSIEDHRIPGLLLMEHASIGISLAVLDLLPSLVTHPNDASRVEIWCGPGNNGGDGLAVARHLMNAGVEVTVVDLVAPGARATGSDAAVQETITDALGIERRDASVEVPSATSPDLRIDAIFGTGLSRPPGGRFRTAIETLNAGPAPVLAVDVPSGLDADRGEPLEVAVRAARTVTLGLPKRGFARPGAEAFTGALSCVPIGASRTLLPPGLPAFPPRPFPLARDLSIEGERVPRSGEG